MVVAARRSSRLPLRHLLFSLLVSLLFTAFVWPSGALADTLFEGYSKVLLDGAHVGYVVQRYEFDAKKQEFRCIYLLKTNAQGGNLSESLKARANAKFNPIAYEYTEVSGDRARTIDANFKGETMTAIVKDGGKQNTVTNKVPKDAFLASFLGYVMLQGKEGIKKGVRYSYKALAEEDAKLYGGEAFIAEEEAMNGVNAFKVLNTYKGTQFASWVTHKGEVVGTRSPVQKIQTELVANIQEATNGMPVNSNTLTALFGSVPKGLENTIARRASEPKAKVLEGTPAPATASNPKVEGVPQGQGVMVKPGAKPATNQ